jgi:hypothetical protein
MGRVAPQSPFGPIVPQRGTICLFVRSLAVMRHVKIIESPNETYPFAAIDQQTGEIPLRLTERDDLVALCDRLGWVVQEDSQSAGAARAADLPQRIGERYRARRPGNRVRHRQGGATKFTSARKRQRAAQRASR